VSDTAAFFRAFHAARPGATSRALARTGIYERFAARVPREGRILDLACGDRVLTRMLGTGAIGVDITIEDRPDVQALAQALPFAEGAFDAVACSLAFMLFDDVERVVDELARVIRPRGTFTALLGGGPTANGHDAFHAFASLLKTGRAFGDRRAKSEEGWRTLFSPRDWRDVAFDRWEIDLSGTFDEVWSFLGASYSLVDVEAAREALRAQFPGERVPCAMACYVGSVFRR
jgi:SAM-dependent methyltransferase